MIIFGLKDKRTERVGALRMKAETASDELLLTELVRVMSDDSSLGTITVSCARGVAGQSLVWGYDEEEDEQDE